MSSPELVVETCSGRLLVVATRCMNVGSHWSSGPQVCTGIEIVACRVGGFCSVGLLGAWAFRALTAAISAEVASTCAKAVFVLVEGRYRILMPAVIGSCCHAAVKLLLQAWLSDRVSTRSSRGEMIRVLQLNSACVKPADADITSTSIAVGLDMVVSTPMIAWKSWSALPSQVSMASRWIGDNFPCSMCRCMVLRGISFVVPKLGRGWSIV